MILENRFSVKVNTEKQRNIYNKIGINCNKHDVINMSIEQLINVGSSIKIPCKCDNCHELFTRPARQIRERKIGGRLCTKCGHSEQSILLMEDSNYRSNLTIKTVAALTGRKFTDSHKENLRKSKDTEKHRKISINNLPEAQFGKDNPSWKHKEGFELFKYYCYFYKKQTAKDFGWISSKNMQIHFKINLKLAYFLGMDPKDVGSKIIFISKVDIGKLNGLKINYLVKRKPPCKKMEVIYPEFKQYRAAVGRNTEKIYLQYKYIINPTNLPRGKQKKGADTYHLDHIIPISICWKKGISVEHCSSVDNLQMLHWHENISKNDKLLETHNQLLNKLILRSNHG